MDKIAMKKLKSIKRYLPLVLGLQISACHYETGLGQKIYTPAEYKSTFIPEDSMYTKDSLHLLEQLNEYMVRHEQSFHSKEYFESTELILDTILYNNTLNRIALFVIAKNPTNRQLNPDKGYQSYYNAYCYIGQRDTMKSDSVTLRWLRNFYPINWYDRKEISSLIRDMHFTEFATIKDTNGLSMYKYNL